MQTRWPRRGDRMRFLNRNGYDHELESARKLFRVRKHYTVVDCHVGDWHHSVAFEGVPGRHNGVMFRRVEELTPKPKSVKHLGRKRASKRLTSRRLVPPPGGG